MKATLFVLVLLPFLISAQIGDRNRTFKSNCFCSQDSSLIFECDTTWFRNQSKLYRQYTCDSSWLTFENTSGKKTILFSLDADMIVYTEHLGYNLSAEYENSFLMENSVATGWDTPPEYVLFDKVTGKMIQDFGPAIYCDEDSVLIPQMGLAVYFKDETYNSLIFYKIQNGKTQELKLKHGMLQDALKKSKVLNVSLLIEKVEFKGDFIVITFGADKETKKSKWIDEKVTFNVREFLDRE